VLIALTLLVSLFIYLFYRTESTVVNEIAITILSADWYGKLKDTIRSFVPLNRVLIYSLPGGLWVFAITLTSAPFYIQLYSRQMHCIYVPLAFSIGLEIFQLLQITNGRFDVLDIVIAIICWSIAYTFFNDAQAKQNLFENVNGKRILCFASYAIVYLSHVIDK
jgi:hypothetical protein